MWFVSSNNLEMAEGDYGIKLPVKVTGTTFTASDSLRFTFKKEKNGDVILEKGFTNIQDSTVNLEFTEQESALFPIGIYCYCLDWYQDGNFMCNVIASATLKVVDKV